MGIRRTGDFGRRRGGAAHHDQPLAGWGERVMDWIRVRPTAGTKDRIVRASHIVEVQITTPTNIKLIDQRGNTYAWTGTMVEYAELVAALGIAGPN